jgi:DNA-binding XRE family transcriptional regulator
MTTLQLTHLAEIREQRLMSRAELARKAEISPLTILKIEKGQRCRPETARKIILGLGHSPEDQDRLFQEIIGPDAYGHNEGKTEKASPGDQDPKSKLRKK